MSLDPPQPTSPPSLAERAIDTATDVSRSVDDVTTALRSTLDRLQRTIADAERPGRPLARLRTAAREAPLASLGIAFLLGIAIRRRL